MHPQMNTRIMCQSVIDDVEKAERGKQWLLSCYGPFHGKPCFPGLEDKSFEEMRLGMYEAQKNGTAEQYKQQLLQYLQAVNFKRKELKNPTPETIKILRELYEAPAKSAQNSNTNLFNNTNTTFNQGSIFANTGNLNKGGTIFGNTSNIYQQGPSVFGGQAAVNSASNFVFKLPESTSVFSNNQVTGSIFTQNKPGTSGSIFNQNQLSAGSIFNQTPISAASVFNQTPVSSAPVFNQTPVSAASAFNQNPVSGGSIVNQNPVSGGSIFTQNPASGRSIFNQKQVSGGSIFNQNQVSGGSIFNQNNQTSTAQLFNQSGPAFNQSNQTNTGSLFNIQPNTGSIFNQNTEQKFVNTGNIFGGTPKSESTIADNFNQNIFSNANAQSTNIFTQNVTPSTSTQNSPFSNSPMSHEMIFQPAKNIFTSKVQDNSQPYSETSAFTSEIKPQQGVLKTNDSTVYSKLEDLTDSDVEQFKAASFTFSKIPITPPTLEFCS